jgi:dihydropteroate synthase
MTQNNPSHNSKPPIKILQASHSKDEWSQDSKSYILIEILPEKKELRAHIYTPNKEYQQSIIGSNPQEIYYTIIRENFISSLYHSAYLGSELEKAYYCLLHNKEYIQDKSPYNTM